MRVIVVHDTLNSCGGAEKLCLETIRALTTLGYQVSLRTVERTDWTKINQLFRYVPKLESEVFLVDRFNHHRLYGSLLPLLLKKRSKGILIFNTNGGIIPDFVDDLSYVHQPMSFSPVNKDKELGAAEVSLFWEIYSAPSILFRRLIEPCSSSFLLTNSKFTRDKIREKWDRDALVLYPPVDSHLYNSLVEKYQKREDLVVTISRFELDKNLELIPWLASRTTQTAKFAIVGSTNSENSSRIINRIIADSKKLSVSEKILIFQNASQLQKQELLARAKILFHPKKYEPFGISIVEGMAAGCIPITYDFGGPKEFVPSNYRVSTSELLPTLVDRSLERWNLKEARILSRMTMNFSPDRYSNKLSELVRKYE